MRDENSALQQELAELAQQAAEISERGAAARRQRAQTAALQARLAALNTAAQSEETMATLQRMRHKSQLDALRSAVVRLQVQSDQSRSDSAARRRQAAAERAAGEAMEGTMTQLQRKLARLRENNLYDLEHATVAMHQQTA
jgi:hypothetical protein